MIRVTVELIPGGTGKPAALDTLYIGNVTDAADIEAVPNTYYAWFGTDPVAEPRPPDVIVAGHWRRSGVWALIALVLKRSAPRARPTFT